MNFKQSWNAFTRARRDMLLGNGDWREQHLRLLRQFTKTTYDSLDDEQVKHLPLFMRSAGVLLRELTENPPTSDLRGRLAFFERTYRFTRVGARLMPRIRK